MKKIPLITLIIVILLTAFFFIQNRSQQQVTNFEECITAGNPAMESYPRQCRHKDQTFTETIGTPTSADNAPPGSLHNLPVPDAVAAVRTYVASELGLSEGIVIVLSAYEKQWPNACLGLATEDEACAQVITPGYEVTLQAGGKQYVYHTNSDGTSLRENQDQ